MYESSGFLPTATTHNADLAGFASAAGVERPQHVDTVEKLRAAVKEAFDSDGSHFIVADVQTPGKATRPAYSRMDEVEGKYRFVRFLEAVEGRKLLEDAIDVKQSIP